MNVTQLDAIAIHLARYRLQADADWLVPPDWPTMLDDLGALVREVRRLQQRPPLPGCGDEVGRQCHAR